MNTLSQNIVTFLSPGTLVHEESTMPIGRWDTDLACEIAQTVRDRHGAIPFAFFFTTRERGGAELDSHESARSGRYYLGGRVETLAEIEARGDPGERILRSNMRGNKWDRIIVNTNSWKITQPLEATDVVLEWPPPQPEKED